MNKNKQFLLQLIKDAKEFKVASYTYNIDMNNIYKDPYEILRAFVSKEPLLCINQEEMFVSESMNTETLIDFLKCLYYIQHLVQATNLWNLDSSNNDDFELLNRYNERATDITRILFWFTCDLYKRQHNMNVISSHDIDYFNSNDEELANNIDKCIYSKSISETLMMFFNINDKTHKIVETFITTVLSEKDIHNGYTKACEGFKRLKYIENEVFTDFCNDI